MKKEDRDIIEHARCGDEHAFDVLFKCYYGKAYAIAFRIMNCDADAHDAAQETMVEIYKSISSLKDIDYFYSWMTRIVISKCNRMYRKKKMVYVDPQKLQKMQSYEETRTYMVPNTNVENDIERKILLGLIYSLRPQLAEALDLMYIQQMKLHEIAEHLHIPLNTAKTRVSRGRAQLKVRVQQFEELEGRKLNFHLHVPLSLLTLGVLRESLKAISVNVKDAVVGYASGSVLQTACVISISILAVSGTAFAVTDSISSKPSNKHTLPQHEISSTIDSTDENPEKEEITLVQNSFASSFYEDEIISTSLDAYYTCMNWAYDKEDMKKRSKEEVEEILPVYQALKKKQDVYWMKLQDKQWNIAFEEIVASYNLNL